MFNSIGGRKTVYLVTKQAEVQFKNEQSGIDKFEVWHYYLFYVSVGYMKVFCFFHITGFTFATLLVNGYIKVTSWT